MRQKDSHVGLAESRDALAVLASPVAGRAATLKPALRALFCATREDWLRFDALFDAFWRGVGMRRIQPLQGAGAANPARRKPMPSRLAAESPPAAESSGGDGASEGSPKPTDRRDAASSAHTLAHRDIRHIADAEEAAKVHTLAERLARRMRARLVRRWRARRGGSGSMSAAPSIAISRMGERRSNSFGAGASIGRCVWCCLLDASGSMEFYTAFFVRFLHAVVGAFREAEAFVFHTRLVAVSNALRDRNVERAIDRLALMSQGIGGGTRIGESLADFNRWHAARVIHSRTAVVIVSDGYDTGEAEQLGAEMKRLARRCRRIVWLNPLIGWRDYAPVARGMRAALPYIDLFAPAHNLESLAALEPYFARI